MTAPKRVTRPDPRTVRGRILLRSDSQSRKRLQIDGRRIALGRVIEVRTEGCLYQLTRLNDVEWVILGSARFRRPTIVFPHDGVIEEGRALQVGVLSDEPVSTAIVTDVTEEANAELARQLIEKAQSEL